jgi:hypothetical protein
MSGNLSKKQRLLTEFETYWDFWLAYAWLMTTSEQLLRDAVLRRNDLGSSDVSRSTPFILSEVCRHTCNCGHGPSCSQWQDAWRILASACAKQKIESRGVPNGGLVSEPIPPAAWTMNNRWLTGDDLDVGTQSWTRITFDAGKILDLFPSKSANPIGPRPGAKATEKYVRDKIASGATQRSILEDAESDWHPDLPPSQNKLREEHRRQVGTPKRGRPSANRP